MNHRTQRSSDVTQGYIHFAGEELVESANRIEHAILEHAGMVESKKGLDAQLVLALRSLSDEEKRLLLFGIMNEKGVGNEG